MSSELPDSQSAHLAAIAQKPVDAVYRSATRKWGHWSTIAVPGCFNDEARAHHPSFRLLRFW
jgi:hypothetical protein